MTDLSGIFVLCFFRYARPRAIMALGETQVVSISRSLAKCRVTSESSRVGGITLDLDKTN